MKSKIAKALELKYEPVAILWSDKKPEKADQFVEGRWGCVMWMLARAAKGKTVVFDRKSYGCVGGGVGLGFGNLYLDFPGGLEGFCYFLSIGNEGSKSGKKITKQIEKFVRKEFIENFLKGERYIKSPDLVKKFVEKLPIKDIPQKYVIFKPLSQLNKKDKPVVIVFIVNPHQLSALIILANYARESLENVIVPMGAGCQQIGIFAYKEAESENPKAVLGLTDLSARRNIRRQLGEDVFTFAIPYKMFQEMEKNVKGSFLERETWKSLLM
ncbi:MAG: DUF169 domain-containing protein [Nitrospirota bacterium]|nr:DUF169 domain-containing protein [Nitrospirota bacterium]MDH5769490.1 DUF169 domain-containing protein [Nitrospirota bacterium]